MAQSTTTELAVQPWQSWTMGEPLVNERVMEYSKDRLNQQIRDLMRENGHLRDTIFRKDFELNELRRQMADAETTHNFLSVTLGVVLLAFMICTVYAIRLAAQVSP